MKRPQAPWYADGLRFECTRCGRCCTGQGYVWVSEERIREIAGHLGLAVGEFTRRYVRRVEGRLSLVDGEHDDCVFWRREEGCTIYEVRPTQCRTFPFWPENLASPEAWAKVAEQVPGIGRGRRHGLAAIRRRRGRHEPADG